MVVPARFKIRGFAFPNHDYEGIVEIEKMSGYRTPDFEYATLDVILKGHGNGDKQTIEVVGGMPDDIYVKAILERYQPILKQRKPYKNPNFNHRELLGHMIEWAKTEPFLYESKQLSVPPTAFDIDVGWGSIGDVLNEVPYAKPE